VQDAFLADDLAFANLELPLDPFRPAAGYPWFNGTREYLAAAVDAGINLFSLANNHAFDGGVEGVLQTIRGLEHARLASTRPFAYSGTRGNPARPFGPVSISVKGVRVGFLALSQFLNEQDGGRYVHVVDYLRPDQAEPFLAWVRSIAPLYDLLIVSYHGDREYVQTPSPAKRAFFRDLLAAGVHIVVGHHPHVVQQYEMVDTGGMRRLAMYSMGNFISGMTWMLAPSQLNGMLAATGESYMLQVQVLCGPGGCSVSEAQPVPIADYQDGRTQMVVARMSDLADGTIAVSPSWRKYYGQRLALMREFLGMK
jgi:poly-gamma-glutamate capsule biosynthesis protein CapA/YwtB (metallophosphatase superfamily)